MSYQRRAALVTFALSTAVIAACAKKEPPPPPAPVVTVNQDSIDAASRP